MNDATKAEPTGPDWFFESDLAPDGSDWLLMTRDRQLIADLRLPGDDGAAVSIDEQEANRHLIKAAPKLRKQLKAISVQIQMAGWTVPHLDAAKRAKIRENICKVIRRFHRAGVVLHVGSDSFNPFVVPGVGLHEELRNFGECGFTPDEAWEAATRGNGVDVQCGFEKARLSDTVFEPVDEISVDAGDVGACAAHVKGDEVLEA